MNAMPKTAKAIWTMVCRGAAVVALTAMLASHLAAPVLAGGCGVCDDDGDGMTNEEELQHGTDLDADPDGDGLTDWMEIYGGTWTNPYNPDSDGDFLSDGVEVLQIGSNPNSYDTDGDG